MISLEQVAALDPVVPGLEGHRLYRVKRAKKFLAVRYSSIQNSLKIVMKKKSVPSFVRNINQMKRGKKKYTWKLNSCEKIKKTFS